MTTHPDLDKLEAPRSAFYNEMRRQGYKTMDIAEIDDRALCDAIINAHLAAQRQGGDAEKIERDLTMYGVSFAQVGKRIDPKDVYIDSPAVTGDRGALEWRDVVGWEGKYIVSSFGDVKCTKSDKCRAPSVDKDGYYKITLRTGRSEQKSVRIHKLVAHAFLGQQPPGFIVNHKDGNKQNNHVTNLEYVSVRENTTHGNRGRSGKTGAHYCKKIEKWKAQTWVSGKKVNIGEYGTEEEAHNAYVSFLDENNIVNKYALLSAQGGVPGDVVEKALGALQTLCDSSWLDDVNRNELAATIHAVILSAQVRAANE